MLNREVGTEPEIRKVQKTEERVAQLKILHAFVWNYGLFIEK